MTSNKKDFYFDKKHYICALELANDVIGGKWKSVIVWHLRDGGKRSGVLQKEIPCITNKMFAQTLRELERLEMVSRKVYPEVPPKVEYELTDRGMSIIPILDSLYDWGVSLAGEETGEAPEK